MARTVIHEGYTEKLFRMKILYKLKSLCLRI